LPTKIPLWGAAGRQKFTYYTSSSTLLYAKVFLIVLMCGAGDAVKPDTFVLNCQLFRTEIQPFTQNSLARARIKHQTTIKTKPLPTSPTMAMLILAQHNNQPTIPRHYSK
jgi:hypothetical protein